MDRLLSQIESPRDLRRLKRTELEQLAAEMREALCNLVSDRTAHFASNLGVIELCLALHTEFDFAHDRLIWDTGHQIYPHKLITGRYHEFPTMRRKGGLMGYPNPVESEYDLFMTGHAGCSISTMLGLKTGDDLVAAVDPASLAAQHDPWHVAVIGDGALPSGIVFEALNNAGGLRKRLIVVLNDNKMSICPRVGGLAAYLDRTRTNPVYKSFKYEVQRVLKSVPLVGEPTERFLWQLKEAVKAAFQGGMLFEELGFHYIGPIDGHDIAKLRRYLKMARQANRPVLLHVLTEKGHGFKPASEDPVFFHTPAPFVRDASGEIISIKKSSTRAYTDVAADAIYAAMQRNPRVTVLTAAMCQGNKLDRIREEIPQRFFDTGICESHAVAFAAGQAKAGLRPIVDIYSTFLQRSYDQIFQEVTLQNLPVTFMMDRAGLTGPDGPTHHGNFDLGYLRVLPNIAVMAPGDEADLPLMLDFALERGNVQHFGPAAIRYPKTKAERVTRDVAPVELGRAEVLREGSDGVIVCCGTLLPACVAAAEKLDAEGLDVGVINARFVKPLDTESILPAIERAGFAITVEEGALMAGFGSAVLEAAADAGISTAHVRRLGIPDRFIEHAERNELLADLGLDEPGIAAACRQMAERFQPSTAPRRRRVS
jgi:1-deoxy-D-xylulose-5-phosphate synthase